jgi:hypothetical protein
MVTTLSFLFSYALIGLLPLGLGACQRTDTLSALPSPNGEMILRDRLLGNHDRVVCVSRTLSEPCSSRTADVYVTGIVSMNDLRVGWNGDKAIWVEIDSGKVVRYTPNSKHGGVSITLVRK